MFFSNKNNKNNKSHSKASKATQVSYEFIYIKPGLNDSIQCQCPMCGGRSFTKRSKVAGFDEDIPNVYRSTESLICSCGYRCPRIKVNKKSQLSSSQEEINKDMGNTKKNVIHGLKVIEIINNREFIVIERDLKNGLDNRKKIRLKKGQVIEFTRVCNKCEDVYYFSNIDRILEQAKKTRNLGKVLMGVAGSPIGLLPHEQVNDEMRCIKCGSRDISLYI